MGPYRTHRKVDQILVSDMADRHTHTQTDTQADRHTDRQTHRQTDTQTDRHTDTQTHRYTDTQEVPDAAAKAMETAKRNHYSAVKDPLQLPPASIIPFVLETSGRLGPSALGFIQRISGAHTYLRSQFFKEINFICAIYSRRMLEATREWMRANPHKWRA